MGDENQKPSRKSRWLRNVASSFVFIFAGWVMGKDFYDDPYGIKEMEEYGKPHTYIMLAVPVGIILAAYIVDRWKRSHPSQGNAKEAGTNPIHPVNRGDTQPMVKNAGSKRDSFVAMGAALIGISLSEVIVPGENRWLRYATCGACMLAAYWLLGLMFPKPPPTYLDDKI